MRPAQPINIAMRFINKTINITKKTSGFLVNTMQLACNKRQEVVACFCQQHARIGICQYVIWWDIGCPTQACIPQQPLLTNPLEFLAYEWKLNWNHYCKPFQCCWTVTSRVIPSGSRKEITSWIKYIEVELLKLKIIIILINHGIESGINLLERVERWGN